MKKSLREYYLETYGEDNIAPNKLIKFYKNFGTPGQNYTYIALKTDATWYITGKENAWSWVQLLNFFEEDNTFGPEAIFIETGRMWEPLFEVEEED